MKFCSKCGKEMPGSASICPHCGFLHRSTNHPRDEGNAEHPGYFGTKEAARQLKVSIGTLSRRCRQGKIPGAEQDAPGSPWRIPVEYIEKTIKNK